MPRTARLIVPGGMYHVTARGNGQCDIFYSDRDKKMLLDLTRKKKKDTGIQILSYCLMNNHIHLFLKDPQDNLSVFMQQVLGSYTRYLNGTYDRTGELFGKRFFSRPIECTSDVQRTIRYIHNNPVKAHICPANEYLWSSYDEFVSLPQYCDIIDAFDLIGGAEGFREIMATADPQDCLVSTNPNRLTDEEVFGLMQFWLHEEGVGNITSASIPVQEHVLQKLRKCRVPVSQLVRITGLGRNYLQNRLRK